MISEIKAAIIAKLVELYPVIERYTDDDIPQDFSKPSFYLLVYDHDYRQRLKVTRSGTLSFDLSYFSDKPVSEMKSDCLEKQETIQRGFLILGSFKAININARVTDNVLHVTFDVRYSEMIKETGAAMQSQATNTNI
jgi:hypothetical protein